MPKDLAEFVCNSSSPSQLNPPSRGAAQFPPHRFPWHSSNISQQAARTRWVRFAKPPFFLPLGLAW
jgi:hypothetical protein